MKHQNHLQKRYDAVPRPQTRITTIPFTPTFSVTSIPFRLAVCMSAT